MLEKDCNDIHLITASKIFHVPLNKVTQEMRKEAKAANCGWLYGMSTNQLQKRIASIK